MVGGAPAGDEDLSYAGNVARQEAVARVLDEKFQFREVSMRGPEDVEGLKKSLNRLGANVESVRKIDWCPDIQGGTNVVVVRSILGGYKASEVLTVNYSRDKRMELVAGGGNSVDVDATDLAEELEAKVNAHGLYVVELIRKP